MPDAQGYINTTAVFGGTCDIRATVRAAARIMLIAELRRLPPPALA
jgi:hypothetical protein